MAKKLLIVDDVEILTATNGLEALETIRSENPNLVFLDVMMPRMNGYEVCQQIKGDPTLSDVYIIMLTAKGQEFDRDRGKDVGADIYMTKPFDPDEILEKSFEILGIEA